MTDQPTDSSNQAEKVFFDALEVDVLEREAYLTKTCGNNVSLRSTVQKMLEELPKASDYIHTLSQHLAVPDELCLDEELERETMIGPYRILGLLGEGGSSKVYEAEQEIPVCRKVALKILKLGMDTMAVISRFEAERQTLAVLEHPNISRVIDAGATDKGRPYFVMELVQGTRITDYCEKNHLNVEDRLRLMCQVCSALQHAHNKGIIHRDIKPSNILVSVVDGVPVPKLIDFGIAKATDTPMNDGRTVLGQPIGTPAYMSPEQFEGGIKDIDTRSDLYSLGVVLYELIGGRPPFDNDELLRIGFEGMRRQIQNNIPPRPLLLLKGKSNSNRNELNWIVMKAIEKDREQRYSTAHSFSADMESYLRNEPVKAHPPSRLYRFKKLIKRNRMASTSIVIAIMALAAGFSISTFLFFRARTAEREQTLLKEAAEERAHVTKAAILIMQEKVPEADAEIRLMGGLLTQPSVEATNVFRTLAMWNAKNGDWKTSADRWLEMSRVNRFDETDMTDKVTRDLLPIAPILVMTNDFARYRDFQHFLLDRLGNTFQPIAAEHLLKLCLLAPTSSSLLTQLRHAAIVAEESLPGDETVMPVDRMEGWRCVALALWYYRNKSPAEAIPWCNRSLLWQDWEEARRIQTRLVRAMSRKLTGDTEGAMEDLEIARTSITEHFKDPLDEMEDGHFHDWLNAKVLLEETEKTVLESE